MEFKIRKNGKYLDVSIKEGNLTIDLGLLDEKERISVASTLKEAIDDLLSGIENYNI